MIVLDCSAAMEIALGTDAGKALGSLMLANEKTMAPAFLKVELANVAWKHERLGYIASGNARSLLLDALALVNEYHCDDDLLEEALTEGLRLNHSVYDMLYLVLARRMGATLFTCDKRLQNLCLGNGVECIAEVTL